MLSGTGVQVAFSSIQHLTGSGTDSLTGPGANNVWQLTGASSGTLGGASFSGFSDLHGGTASDTFRVTEGATFAGSIDGAGGIDKLDYAAFAGGVNVNLAAGSATGFAGGVSGIENVSGGEGDDVIRGDDNANIIAGRGGNDILLGGGGNDTLSGGTGRDFLIGGTGADLIVGNAQEDILVAGTTAYDGNDTALAAIMAEWNSGDTYAIRVANITVGTNVAGGFYLNGSDGAGQTVFTDSDVDTLTGSGGSDWFFANQTADNGGPLDIVTDLAGSEIWSDTDF
jgi:Ca2+-binding RTX toxin-like protein